MSDVSLPIATDPAARRAFTMHERTWQSNRYVYPVVSRRSKGISIGVNLNPDKVCNFDCIYCSVDRREPPAEKPARDVDLAVMAAELQAMLSLALSGEIYRFDPFDKIPAALRRINDIAFSGDGEPTTCPQFDAALRLAADLVKNAECEMRNTKRNDERRTPNDERARIKLVLITNATMFHRESVRETLTFLDQHHGEIWAKLDAGTAKYYSLVDRTPVPFGRVLENLKWCCQTRPTVIQSLFMKVHREGPSAAEITAYAQRLQEITAAGGQIKLVQLYTVARRTTESYATALSAKELECIAVCVQTHLSKTPMEIYP